MGFSAKNYDVNVPSMEGFSSNVVDYNYVDNPLENVEVGSQESAIEVLSFTETGATVSGIDKTKVVDFIKDYFEFKGRVAATGAVFVLSLVEGVGQFGEALVDTAATLEAVVESPFAWAADKIAGLFGYDTHFVDNLWKDTKAFVAEEHVKGWFDSFYENTEVGQKLANDAYYFEQVRGIGNGVGYVGGVVALTVLTCGTGTAAMGATGGAAIGMSEGMGIIGAAGGFGKGTQKAWSEGASTTEGLTYGLGTAAWEGTQFYLGGKIGEFGGLGDQMAVKMFGENAPKLAGSASRITLDMLDGGVEGVVQPGLDSIYKDGTYKELFEQNGGWKSVGIQALMAGGMSTVGETGNLRKYFFGKDTSIDDRILTSNNAMNTSGSVNQPKVSEIRTSQRDFSRTIDDKTLDVSRPDMNSLGEVNQPKMSEIKTSNGDYSSTIDDKTLSSPSSNNVPSNVGETPKMKPVAKGVTQADTVFDSMDYVGKNGENFRFVNRGSDNNVLPGTHIPRDVNFEVNGHTYRLNSSETIQNGMTRTTGALKHVNDAVNVEKYTLDEEAFRKVELEFDDYIGKAEKQQMDNITNSPKPRTVKRFLDRLKKNGADISEEKTNRIINDLLESEYDLAKLETLFDAAGMDREFDRIKTTGLDNFEDPSELRDMIGQAKMKTVGQGLANYDGKIMADTGSYRFEIEPEFVGKDYTGVPVIVDGGKSGNPLLYEIQIKQDEIGNNVTYHIFDRKVADCPTSIVDSANRQGQWIANNRLKDVQIDSYMTEHGITDRSTAVQQMLEEVTTSGDYRIADDDLRKIVSDSALKTVNGR